MAKPKDDAEIEAEAALPDIEGSPGYQRQMKRPTGRPPAEIDLDLLGRLSGIHCTMDEAAAVLGVGVATLSERIARDPATAEVWERGRMNGRASLRRFQFQQARTNARMAIWLGQQYLGQRDVRHVDVTAETRPEGIQQAEKLALELSTEDLKDLLQLSERLMAKRAEGGHDYVGGREAGAAKRSNGSGGEPPIH